MKELTLKQKNVLNFIITEMDTNGFPPTVREIGNEFLITPKGAYDHLKAIEKKEYIRCHKNRSRAIEILVNTDDYSQKKTEKSVMIPLLGTVAAGTPIFAEENVEDYIPVPKNMVKSGTTFSLRVKGDSMIDRGIMEGDLALIRKTKTAINGEIVVALIDGEATLKIFKKEKSSIKLIPANKAYKPIIVRKIEILGKLIGLLRYYH